MSDRPKPLRLSSSQVIAIREMYRAGSPAAAIAEEFSLSATSIDRILIGRRYPDVPGALSPNEKRKPGVSPGSLCTFAKIDELSVEEIRREASSGFTYKEIAKNHGISISHACNIATGRTWKHVGKSIKKKGKIRPKSYEEKRGRSNAKLDETKVSYIRAHLMLGVASCLLVKYFGVTKGTISQIARKMTWKKVKPHPSPPPVKFTGKPEIVLRGERLKEKIGQFNHAR